MLLDRDWELKIFRTYIEANFVVDGLATMARRLQRRWHGFEHPPETIQDLVHNDSVGVYCNGLVCNHDFSPP